MTVKENSHDRTATFDACRDQRDPVDDREPAPLQVRPVLHREHDALHGDPTAGGHIPSAGGTLRAAHLHGDSRHSQRRDGEAAGARGRARGTDTSPAAQPTELSRELAITIRAANLSRRDFPKSGRGSSPGASEAEGAGRSREVEESLFRRGKTPRRQPGKAKDGNTEHQDSGLEALSAQFVK